MLNRPLPVTLRRHAWELLLVRRDIRTEYEGKMETRVALTISNKDVQITHMCQRLLVSEFAEVASASRLAVTMMKTVLSYVHILSGAEMLYENDPDLLYLAVPLLQVFKDECNCGLYAFMVERYCGLISMARPHVLPGGATEVTREDFNATFMAVLKKRDPELDGIFALAEGPKAPVRDEVLKAVNMLSSRLFVGLSNLDVVSFVWDQCLCTKLQLLMPLCAAVITLSRRELLAATSGSQAREILSDAARSMSVPALQQEMEHRYHEDLVQAGMPAYEVSGESKAPFLFADDMSTHSAGSRHIAAASSSSDPRRARAVAGAVTRPGVAASSKPAPPPNPLIQAMVGVVDETQASTEAFDKGMR